VLRGILILQRATAALARIKEMNPRVEVSVDVEPLSKKKDDYFAKFDVVVLSVIDPHEIDRINAVCRKHGTAFYSTFLWDQCGFIFCDAIEREDDSAKKDTESKLKWKSFKDFIEGFENPKAETIKRRRRTPSVYYEFQCKCIH
jgi:molybdopterin/thiamine biosynthesis adenylyltransferase